MAWIGAIIAGVGALDSASAEEAAGEANLLEAKYEAALVERDAGQELAVSQRQAMIEKKNADLFASRALAVAAAGGGGVSDPSVANIIADITGEGAYRQALALYSGKDTAMKMREESTNIRRRGEIEKVASDKRAQGYYTQAVSSMFDGFSKSGMGSKYGGQKPAVKPAVKPAYGGAYSNPLGTYGYK
jgi:hypothetical protein